MKELKEQVLEFRNLVNLDSYVHYFYDDTASFLDLFDLGNTCVFVDEPARVKEHAKAVELEFRESMMHRVEKGYILPGQMNLLYSVEHVAAKMERGRVVTLAALDMKNTLFKAEKRRISRSKASHLTITALRRWYRILGGIRKTDTGSFCCPVPGQGLQGLPRILWMRNWRPFIRKIRTGNLRPGKL